MRWFCKFFLFFFCCSFLWASEDSEFWGYHLILNCKGCEADIDDGAMLSDFVKDLVVEIDMKAYKEPLLEYFAEHNKEVAGYSLMQFIETSAITGHFVSKNGDAYLDIFSCKYFDPEKAIKFVKERLRPEKVGVIYLTRQA